MASTYPTKTSMLNPRRIHEIYMNYVDEHLFTKYLHGSHVDTFHDDEIHVGSISIFRGNTSIYRRSRNVEYTKTSRVAHID